MDHLEENQKHPMKAKHKELNRHECLFCFRAFATAARLRRHSIVHSTEKKIFHCQFCELSFRLHKELLMHEATHKRTLANINLKRCKICGIACYNDNLLAHLKQYHEYFECDLCKKIYRTKNHMKLHMRTHINAREYQCSICPKAFNFFSQLKRHERSHSTTYVWYCEICGVGFKNKPNLAHHMRSHNGEKPFQCDRCDRCFSAKQSLHLHIRIHDGEKPYKCPWAECGRGFHDLATMKVHTRLHTNESPYKCHLCGKTTKQASNLKSHYLHAHKIRDITSKTIRANARLFQKYKTENLPEAGLLEILSQQVMENLERQQTDANVSTIKQESAIREVAREKLLNQFAEQLHGKIMTEQISSAVNMEQSSNVISDGRDMVNSVNLLQSQTVIKVENLFDFPHEQTTSSNNSNVVDVQDKKLHIKEEVVCESSSINIINEVIPSVKSKLKKENLKIGNNNQRIRQKPQQDIEKVFVDEQQSAELDIKGVIFKQEQHIDEFQITKLEDSVNSRDKTVSVQLSRCTTTDSPSSSAKLNLPTPTEKSQKRESNDTFTCDICPSSFRQKIKLKVHMKSHAVTTANDKKKMCEICGKTYTQNSALKKHLQFTHSNFRPFPCKICGRAFKDSNGLKVHLRSHSGEKPYSCSFCTKSFSTSMGRNLHQRGHTGEKPYKCPYCDSAFSDNSTYRQHIRVHTGEKPYVCHLCGKGTTQAGNLKSHLRHAHKIQMKNVTMKLDK